MTMTYALRHRWWGRAVRDRYRIVSGARAVSHDRPLPRADAAGAADRVRRRHRIPALRGVDVARRPRRRKGKHARGPAAFVLAELGDKTMLATVALASDHHWAGVWIGATAGMVLADGVAIAVGVVLHKRLPERFLHGMASLLFAVFGLWLLFDRALGWRRLAVGAVGSVVVSAALRLNRPRSRRYRRLATADAGIDLHSASPTLTRVTCQECALRRQSTASPSGSSKRWIPRC
jgi:Ca2+/H+ antiporter, TMEM165/GDT1 family